MSASSIQNAVAVIGMSGRFPGARDVDAFWRLLREGRDGIREFDREELRRAGIPESIFAAPNFVPRRPVIDNPLDFDPAFFGYTKEDAAWIDPQQRVFLECAWEALETAATDPAKFPGWIGVFGGCDMNSYFISRDLDLVPLLLGASGMNIQVNNDKDYLATRVAYKLNLKGPAVTVQSACSTGMVALQLSCQSLLVGQCDLAVAGAVAISFPQERCYLQHENALTSADGRCRPFDAGAGGTVFGDGAAVLVLRRLEDAIAANDPILAIVRSTAANNDGNNKPGFLTPSVSGQESVISVALKMAEVDPKSISYIEAHGTGTAVGDSIEFHALRKTYGRYVSAQSPCAIGSVKSNVGHSSVASGLTGVIKIILMMRHRELVPTVHFRKPNPTLQLEGSGFRIDSACRAWEAAGPRRAAVSCFGIGGTNVHAVFEEPPAAPPSQVPGPWTFLLSGRTASAVEASAKRLSDHLAANPHIDLGDVAFTLRTGRRHHSHRVAVTASDLESAVAGLAQAGSPTRFQDKAQTKRNVCLFFPRGGVEFAGMAGTLYAGLPRFRAHFDACMSLLPEAIRIGLDSALRRQSSDKTIPPTLAEPGVFAVEYALAMLWKEAGIVPVALCGQGLGELVAATVAGIFDLESGLQAACVRGQMESPVASPTGYEAAGLGGNSVGEGVSAHYCRILQRMPLQAPQVAILSNPSGKWVTAEEATDPSYWAGQFCESDACSRTAAELLCAGANVFLESGPGDSRIESFLREAPPEARFFCVASARGEGGGATDEGVVQQAAGKLWALGARLDWDVLCPRGKGRRIYLPPMAFDRVHCSVAQRQGTAVAGSPKPNGQQPLLDCHRDVHPAEPPHSHGNVETTPDQAELGDAEGLPTSEAERMVVKVWREVLKLTNVGMTLNFFEAGGDSIRVIEVVAKLKAEGWLCEVDDVMQYQTPSQLATRLTFGGVDVREVAPFAMVNRNDDRVTELLSKHGDLEDLYPLTPIQEQVLAQNMMLRRSVGDVHFIESELHGPLEFPLLRAAWTDVMTQHPILRTAIFWRRLSSPLQGVYANPDTPVVFLDHTGLSDSESATRLADLRIAQIREGFPLHGGVLWKAFIVRQDPQRHRLMWFYYASLFDAWSARNLEKDLLNNVRRLEQGLTTAPGPVRFANYVDWLRKRDVESAKVFWTEHFRGFAGAPARFASDRVTAITERSKRLTESATTQVLSFAKSATVTASSVVQAAWAAVWARWSQSSDFVVGMISSGRPAEVPKIDQMAGLFTQVLPVRIVWDASVGLVEWVQSFQRRLEAVRREEHVSASQILEWSRAPKEFLRDAILTKTMVFLNAVDEAPASKESQESNGDLAERHGVPVPLRLYVKPARQLSLALKYDDAQFSEDTVVTILNDLEHLLSNLPRNPSLTLGEWGHKHHSLAGAANDESSLCASA